MNANVAHEEAPPYPGPRAFAGGEDDRFFGRAAEVARLRSLVVARRAVLLFAPSGAGKTSLLRAGLLPALRARGGITAFPLARVGAPLGAAARNPFVLSVLLDLLAAAAPLAAQPAVDEWTLAAGLTHLLRDEPEPLRSRQHLLVLDPFEEVFTAHLENPAARAGFFAELAEALDRHPQVSLLLSMREDFVGPLEPFLPLLPDRLRSRLRLGLLGTGAARAAIAQPARQAGVAFTDAALTALVDDLRRVRLPPSDGRGATIEALGEEVEPVQLQVVCRRLWERRDPERREIGADLLTAAGSVDSALADFYAGSVAAASAAGATPERRVRAWIGHRLVTANGLRAQVLAGADRTGGLPDAVLAQLVASHLLRAEERRGLWWYELAHDRLVAPLQADNAAWEETHVAPWERRAAEWQREDRPAALLLAGEDLADAERRAAADPDLEPAEGDFLAACRAARAADRRGRRRRRLGWAAAAVTLLSLALGFGVAHRATREQLRLARIEGVAGQALERLDEQQDLGLLLSLAVGNLGDAARSRRLLFAGLEQRPHFLAVLAGHGDNVLTVAYSPDGRRLASAGQDGTVRRWDGETGAVLGVERPAGGGEIWALAWSLDGRLAAAGRGGPPWVWEPGALHPRRLAGAIGEDEAVWALAWSPDGRWLYGAAADQKVERWDAVTGEPAAALSGGGEERIDWLASIAVSPDGRSVAAADMLGVVRRWDAGSGRELPALRGHDEGVTAVAYRPGDGTLASASLDGTVRFWDLGPAPCARRPPLDPGLGALQSLAWSADGRRLAVGAVGGALAVWDEEHQRFVDRPWRGAAAPLHGLAFRPDGRRLASGSAERVALWDPTARSRLTRPVPPAVAAMTALRRRSPNRLRSPQGDRLAAGGERGEILVSTLAGRAAAPLRLAGPRQRVLGLAWSPDGTLFAAGRADGNVELWDTAGSAAWAPYPGVLAASDAPIAHLDFLPGGRGLLAVDREGRTFLWDLDPGSWRGSACRLAGRELTPEERQEAGLGAVGALCEKRP